ncbi:MAG: alpha-glucosidase [Candidatus Binatia bacterium]|nr:MAG: alpha-glucosidase [Candidatus Binatia bacterium]
MNVPAWLADWLARPLPVDPPPREVRELPPPSAVSEIPAGWSFACGKEKLEARFLSDGVLEIVVRAEGEELLPSFARVEKPPSPPEVSRAREGSTWRLATRALEAAFRSDSSGFEVRGAWPLAGRAVATERGWRVRWELEPEDRLYGLGAKVGGLRRNGRRTLLWAWESAVTERSDPLYSSVPFLLLARRGAWSGLWLDSAARSVFDLGATDPRVLEFGPRTGPLVVVVLAGPTLGEVLARFTSWTGRPPLPPLWALGHHQSRYSYADEEEVREVASRFRKRGIPTDAIHLDIHYMDGYRVFTFDRERFPDPRRLSEDLARQGFRLVAITDPGLKVDRRYEPYRQLVERRFFVRRTGGEPFTMYVWPGKAAFPDFLRAEVRQWWAEWLRVYVEAGIAGIWNDMNEPSGWRGAWYVGDGVVPFGEARTHDAQHVLEDGRVVPHLAVRNAYGHLHSRATYEGLRRHRPGERPFVLTRSAFAGTQRYAAQWTGDVLSSWSLLRATVPMLLSLGLSGMSFAGSDIGGFFGDCTPELYARWVQLGALSPFARTHTALHTRRQEPWSFGPEVEEIARRALELRYRLLPYLYTCFWETSRGGMPVWRPLFAEFPDDAPSWDVEDEVLVGPSLLAAPVLEKGARRREVYLPPGRWFDWASGLLLEGGRTLDVAAPLATLPLYVRANSAIPTVEGLRHTGDRPTAPIVWRVFLAEPVTEGRIGGLYEDDGLSFAYVDGFFRWNEVEVVRRGERLVLRFLPGEGRYRSPRTEAVLELVAPGFEVVAFGGGPVPPAPIRFSRDRMHEVELAPFQGGPEA